MLSIERLCAHYDIFQALFDVDLKIQAGETVALIGANGAGKSTLLRSIVGTVKVSRKSIVIDATEVGGDSELQQLARGVALVPEGRRLFPSLTVHENLKLAAKNGRPGNWTVERLLEEVPILNKLKDRPATMLSGGQQQLVALSRALVTNPLYLLFDEVSLGLSPLAVDEVYRLMRRVRSDGMAIVLVEQNVRRALTESDRFYCMQKGRIVLAGISKSADYSEVTQAYFGV